MAHENDWVADVLSYTREWTNIASDWSFSFDGQDVWTDGNDIYISCSGRRADYVLNKSTLLWETKSWTWEGGRPTPFGGQNIWTDGTDMYYSYGTKQYVLNKSENKWYKKTWTGNLTSFYGEAVWTDGTDVYYSMSNSQYVLDKANSTWNTKTWNGMTNFYGTRIWSDGTNIYYSKEDQSSGQRVLNKTTSTWETVTWYKSTGSTFNLDGTRIWTDGTDMYYSSSFDHYVLNKSDMKWYTKTWTGLSYISSGAYIWNYGDHVYYSYSSTQYELKKNVVTSVPYRSNFNEMIESIDPYEKWFADNADNWEVEPSSWSPMTWPTRAPKYGSHVWSIGDTVYYSYGDSNNQYVLNKENLTWELKTWSGVSWLYGNDVWTDGENYFYDDSSEGWHYVLNKETSKWSYRSWIGFTPKRGIYVWTDGKNTYYSEGTSQYVLDKSTLTWSAKTWNGYSSIYGHDIWTDGTDIYYSYGTTQYVLDKATSTWIAKSWNGYSSIYGQYIWHCGEFIFYSRSSATSSSTIQYVLDKATSTWIAKSWTGINLQYWTKAAIWSDGENIYFSYTASASSSQQYKLNREKMSSVPYRLNFPELKESIDLRDKWLTEPDPDAPTSDIEFDPNYRYVKLEFDYTVALNTTLTSESATTDLPNSGINISSGGYWWQRWLEIRPKTPVASRLYAAEFAIKEDNGLSDYYTKYLVQMEKGHNNGDVQAMTFNMEPRASGYSANTADLSTNGTSHTSDTNTVYYNNSVTPVANLNNQVGVIIVLDQNSDEPEVKSGTVTCKLYYCFDPDEAGYEALLAEYPNHASPYSPEPPTKVPYRLNFPEMVESIDIDSWVISDDIPFRPNFPELKESIDIFNSWLISDDIPFRWNFPPLIPSVVPSDAWLQDKGWDPRRPWPNHRSIIQKVQTIPNIPEVDWTKSMQQTFEFYTVDPNTWYDDTKLENIISCDITHDLTSDKRGNASITISEPLPECYIRTYLVVTQAGFVHKICLGTYLYMTSSDSFDGMKHNITMTGYTPMVELEEKLPPLGFHIVGITNRKHSGDAPMVTDAIKDIVTTYTRCEIENRTIIQKPLLNDFVAGTNDTFLAVINNILDASSLQQYILTVDEWGTIIVKDKPVLEDAIPTYIYTDDNSSILLPSLDTNDDIYGIPNVIEVLYTGDKRLPAIRVIVKNEDPTSIVSIQARGREIAKRYTITNIAAPANDYSEAAVRAQVTDQAERLLEAASTIQKTISYSHGYCDVKVGDTVLINYERAGFTGVRAKVVSQRIACKPGCQVDEQAVYTKKLWNRGV